MPRGAPFVRAAVLVGLSLGPGSSLPSADSAVRYPLEVVVEWGSTSGPESVRAALAEEVVGAVGAAGCFAAVHHAEAAPPPDDARLRLRLAIETYHEEVLFEYGAAALGSPEPGMERRAVARVQADFHAAVRLDDSLLHEQRFRVVASWRPTGGEDARDQVQRRLEEDVVRRMRRFACRGGSAKWQERIDRQRRGAERGGER